MNTILQVPMSKELRDQASSKAQQMGFSSLQETVRIFLNKLAVGEVGIRFEDIVELSPKAAARYNKMIDEIEQGKVKTKSFSDVDSLMNSLNED